MTGGNGKDKDFEDVIADITNLFKNRKSSGQNQQPPDGPSLRNFLPIIIVAALVLAGFNSFYTVQADEEAVVTQFGRYQSSNGPGLHFKLPFVEQVYKVSKRRMEQEFGYRKATRRQAKGSLTDESQMLTGDLNLADVEWMVQYQVSDPRKYLFHVRDVERTIRDVSMSAMRRIVGDQLVGEVLTTGRAEIATRVAEYMQETLDHYDMGLEVLLVELQSVDPPDQVKAAFNDVTAAKQEQEQAINKAEREYNRIIPEARGRAQKMQADADAYAVNIVNRAKGEAEHFSKVYAAYSKAPDITRKRLYLEAMEEVFLKSDKFTIVDSKISGLLPIFNEIQTPKQSATPPKTSH